MKFIGVNGGTFDPIHYGHLRPALEVYQQLGLDHVRFVPCYRPVHREQPQANGKQRCDMIEVATRYQDAFELDTFEMEQPGPSYMVHTLLALKQQFKDESLVLMMGTDAFAKFHTWHDWERILKLANIAVMHRPGEPIPVDCESGVIYQAHYADQLTEQYGQIVDVAVTQLDISSTDIKAHFQRGDAVDYLLPPSVENLIKQQGLYKNLKEEI